MIGMTVTAISMITVPVTVGVMIRRNIESRAESTNWQKDEMTIRVASSPGPPCMSAVTLTAMKAPEGAHQEDVSGADAPEAHRLQHRGQPTDDECREHRPRHVGITLASRPDHDHRRQHDTRDAEHGLLEAEAEGKREGWAFVGFVADFLVGANGCVAHCENPVSARHGHCPGYRAQTACSRRFRSSWRRPDWRSVIRRNG